MEEAHIKFYVKGRLKKLEEVNIKFYVKVKNGKRLLTVLQRAEDYGYIWSSTKHKPTEWVPANASYIAFDTKEHKIAYATEKNFEARKIDYKDFIRIRKMREKLTEHCAGKSCMWSGCVLDKSDCRCGRGASFQTKKSDGTYKMSELEIVDAYYKVFPKEDTKKSIEEKSEFLEKFEDGKEYIFDKSTFYKYEKEERGNFNKYLWVDIIDNSRIKVLDFQKGAVEGYIVNPQWCIENKEKKQITDKDCFEWLLTNYYHPLIMKKCFGEDLSLSTLQKLGINNVVEKIKKHLESEE